MSRCYYLDYESTGFFSGVYRCKLCGKTFHPDDSSSDERQVEYTCKEDCEHCDIYKNR